MSNNHMTSELSMCFKTGYGIYHLMEKQILKPKS